MSNILEMQNEIAKPKPLEAYNWSTIISKNLKEKEYILEPLIREKDIIMIYAKTGLGKTLISTGIAWAISKSTQFLGWKCNKVKKTLFIDGEMPLISIKERVQILTSDIENDNFRVLSHDTLNDNQLMPDLSTIDGQRNIEHLTEWADFIVLDNLATLCRSGQENSTEAWRTTQDWLLSLRAKGKAILIVDHAGKNGTNRGASAKQDVLDTVITLKHPNDYDPIQGARFIINVEKNRNANPIENIEAHLINGDWKVSDAKDTRDQRILELKQDGLNQTEIAEEIGCNKSTVSRVLSKHNK
ncbi:MAG: putative ATP-dependent serine protease [Francisella sp.]|jgi:predicted ATP-dependent serine protease